MAGKYRLAALALAAALVCAGCQPTPEAAAVTSKNDGTFEAALKNEAAETTAAGEPEYYTDSFETTDGSVTYNVALDVPDAGAALPVLLVSPHTITAEEAQRAAAAIFGDAEIYEYSTERTRAELEDAILSLRSRISDWDALVEHYEGDEETAQNVKEDYEKRIAALEAEYETASDTIEPQPCQWTFYPWSHYDDPMLGVYEDEDGLETIMATAATDDILYKMTVVNRDEDDYCIHSISVGAVDVENNSSALALYCGTEPTEDDVARAAARAEKMLADMGLGDWTIASTEVMSWEDVEAGKVYQIRVDADPVYYGLASSSSGLEDTDEDGYAASYAYESAFFIFGGEHLLSFSCEGLLDVTEVVNANVQTLSFAEVAEKFEAQMRVQAAAYSWGSYSAHYDVVSAKLELARVRVKNSAAEFYLVPAYTFYGERTLYNASGEMIQANGADNEPIDDPAQVMAVINAVDGSVINTVQGY